MDRQTDTWMMAKTREALHVVMRNNVQRKKIKANNHASNTVHKVLATMLQCYLPVFVEVVSDVSKTWTIECQDVREKCIRYDFLFAVLVDQADHCHAGILQQLTVKVSLECHAIGCLVCTRNIIHTHSLNGYI